MHNKWLVLRAPIQNCINHSFITVRSKQKRNPTKTNTSHNHSWTKKVHYLWHVDFRERMPDLSQSKIVVWSLIPLSNRMFVFLFFVFSIHLTLWLIYNSNWKNRNVQGGISTYSLLILSKNIQNSSHAQLRTDTLTAYNLNTESLRRIKKWYILLRENSEVVV